MVAAVAMVRDEVDIVESTIRHLATQVDFLIVADHGSVDGTREVLEALTREVPLTVVDNSRPGYYQAEQVTALAASARERGAEWIVPFDADELLYSPLGRVADVLGDSPESVLLARSYDHVSTAEDDPSERDPVRRIVWRGPRAAGIPKVVCRARPDLAIHQGAHVVAYGSRVDRPVPGRLEIRHFPYRSLEQFERKIRNGVAAYAASDLPEGLGGHWRDLAAILEAEGAQGLRRAVEGRHHREDPRVESVVDGERWPPLVLDPFPVGGG